MRTRWRLALAIFFVTLTTSVVIADVAAQAATAQSHSKVAAVGLMLDGGCHQAKV
ncbi:MAG TPA: hypothetical protein VGX23_11850 [Actinocrinis sp.]|nr:hypothetical protein [Actinocrinis sp.]